MQKDVIYIDVEDDITAIIGKVKAAEHKIVALVPPKRTGAIQSTVNLKLVQRAAETAGKRLVLISNNAALIALAGNANIPVAKNLQSRPELAEIPALAVDEEDDIIDGSKIKDGTKDGDDSDSMDDVVTELESDEKGTPSASPSSIRAKEALGATAVKKSKIKIPDFNKFRKRLFLIIGGVVLLTGFLVWAFIFAPSAKIIVTARTTDSQLSTKITLGDSLTTDLKNGTLKTITKTTKKTISVPFTATGKKDVGAKATGVVQFSNSSDSSSVYIPTGSVVTASSGKTYTTNTAASVPGATVSHGQIVPGTVSVNVTASASGTSYNGATGAATSDTGIGVSFTTATSGGTDQTITVVQQSDVDAVSSSVGTSSDADTAKQSLTKAFGSDYVVLTDSFKQDTSGVKASPAVGAEASDGKGTMAGDIIYTLMAVPKSELTKFLNAYFTQQIDGMANQKVYSNGLSSVAFTNFSQSDTAITANIAAIGKYGPKIDENDIKANAKGKRYGEIQSYIQEVPGVDGVDIKFSPFWVTTAPNDTAKIQVEFKVNGS
jgi:hypothetical protein